MRTVATALLALIAAPAAHADCWGGISGRIVIRQADAKQVPKLKPLFWKGDRVKDREVCATADAANFKLIVDRKTRGVKNVFVYLHKANATHPSLRNVPKTPVKLRISKCRFQPHAFFIRASAE